MNDEMRQRSLDLREANAVMEAILHSKGVGIIVVDDEQRVRAWSNHSEELWGLRADEVVGTMVAELDSGFPFEEVSAALRGVLKDGHEPATIQVPATDRRGRTFQCKVTVLPLIFDGGAGTAAIVLAERAAAP